MENLVIAGRPSIIIRCGCDFNIGSEIFKKDQIVAIINNCNTNFSYGSSQKTINQRAAILAYNENVELNNIFISSVPFNKMLYKLVFSSKNENIWKPNIFSKKPENKIIAIPTSKPVKNVEVYDLNYNKIDFNFDNTNNIITVNTDNEVMVCYYLQLNEGLSITTNPSSLPYFNIECINKGNSIGENNREPIIQYIKLHKCALMMEPFILYNDDISNFDLAFNIIKDEKDIIQYGRI